NSSSDSDPTVSSFGSSLFKAPSLSRISPWTARALFDRGAVRSNFSPSFALISSRVIFSCACFLWKTRRKWRANGRWFVEGQPFLGRLTGHAREREFDNDHFRQSGICSFQVPKNKQEALYRTILLAALIRSSKMSPTKKKSSSVKDSSRLVNERSASSFGLRSLKEVVAELEANQKPDIQPQNLAARNAPTPTPPPTNATPSPEDLPLYVRNDPGFRCLTDQLARVRAERRVHEDFKRRLAEAEEEEKRARREKKASAAKKTTGGWVRAFDGEANAEYFYNESTGEASWLPPPTNEGSSS
ncbi:hypothetical protein THAOC_15526, partial [Thalassiosira oceanica]